MKKILGFAAGIILAIALTAGYSGNNLISADGKWYSAKDATYGVILAFNGNAYGMKYAWVPAKHCIQLWETLGINTHTVCGTSTAGKWTLVRDVIATWMKTTK